ncbi:hypothetical protein PINS_up024265 [Pythium insidiosum]|nr:hypothetical protein PINS_up024265 [Pythium insidiosum]
MDPLYAVIIVLDLTLLVAHLFTTMEIVKWITLPHYSELQEWIYEFENSDDVPLVAPQSVHQTFLAQSIPVSKQPPKAYVRPSLSSIPALVTRPRRSTRQQEGAPPASRRRMTRSLASTMQRFPSYARLMTTAVEFDEVQFYSFFSALVLPADAFYAAHDDLAAAVVADHPTQLSRVDLERLTDSKERAYRFVRYTYITNAEVIVVGALRRTFGARNISSRSVRSSGAKKDSA